MNFYAVFLNNYKDITPPLFSQIKIPNEHVNILSIHGCRIARYIECPIPFVININLQANKWQISIYKRKSLFWKTWRIYFIRGNNPNSLDQLNVLFVYKHGFLCDSRIKTHWRTPLMFDYLFKTLHTPSYDDDN